MRHNSVQISKIANGYLVIAPEANGDFPRLQPPHDLYESAKKEDPKYYIPKQENAFFCESLEKVNEFLKQADSVESPNNGFYASPTMIG